MVLTKGPAEGDISYYRENPEFVLENFYANVEDQMFPISKIPFTVMTFTIQIQRRTNVFLFTCIIPCIIINIVCKY